MNAFVSSLLCKTPLKFHQANRRRDTIFGVRVVALQVDSAKFSQSSLSTMRNSRCNSLEVPIVTNQYCVDLFSILRNNRIRRIGRKFVPQTNYFMSSVFQKTAH